MEDQVKTAISVNSDDPKDQVDADVPYDVIIGDFTGFHEPPAEDAEVGEDPGKRFEPVEVTGDNYEELLNGAWGTRVVASVPNHLGDDPDETLAVDVLFRRRTEFWPSELDQIPELAGVIRLLGELDRLQSRLASRPADRKKLEKLIAETMKK